MAYLGGIHDDLFLLPLGQKLGVSPEDADVHEKRHSYSCPLREVRPS